MGHLCNSVRTAWDVQLHEVGLQLVEDRYQTEFGTLLRRKVPNPVLGIKQKGAGTGENPPGAHNEVTT